MPRFQRLLLIITLVLVTVMLGVLIYAAFFGPRVARIGNGSVGEPAEVVPPGGGGAVGTNARLPGVTGTPIAPAPSPLPQPTPVSPIASGGTTKTQLAVDANTLQLTIDRDGSSLLYYNADDGRFYRLTGDGAVRPLTDRVFHLVQQITWSNDRQRAVLEYPDGANIIYDFATQKQVTLPTHWERFSFSPDGEQIVAKSIGQDTENRYLVVTDSSGSRSRPIAALGANAGSVTPNWSPNGQMVALQVETSGSNRQEVFFIGLNDERFPSTFVPGWGFEGKWTPDGGQLLYSVYTGQNGNRPELWLVEASPTSVGANRRTVGLQTWAHKCTMAGATVAYCAVPQSLPEAAGLFPNEMDSGPDSLYRVDLSSGAATIIARPDQAQSMQGLQVASDGRSLYYTARQDGRVYRIQLK